MPHYIPGLSQPVSNNNIANIYCDTVLNTTDETYVSPLGGSTPNFPSDTGELLQVVSTSASDLDTVLVQGLDENFLELEEVVQLNGTTPVQTVNAFTRINDVLWLGDNAFQGQILVQQSGGGVNYRSMSVSSQISDDGVFTVPADRLWQVPLIYASMVRDANQQSTGAIRVYTRPIGKAFRRPFQFSVAMRGNSSNTYDNRYPLERGGPADFYVTAEASDPGSEVVARLTIVMRTA